MTYKILSYGLSDVGLVRENNEDVWAQQPETRFFVLADGMGGHQAGEIAARTAVDTLCETIQKTFAAGSRERTFLEAHAVIEEAILDVNSHIYKLGSSNREWLGMGTTLCCLLIHDQGIVYGHVGDSRIYRFRKNRLEQLTKDHSLLREMTELGKFKDITLGEVFYKNILTKAIGTEPTVEPSVHVTDVLNNDLFLLCSDGLTDMLGKEEIESILKSHDNLDKIAHNLVCNAKERGGVDNITVLLVRVQDGDEGTEKDLSR